MIDKCPKCNSSLKTVSVQIMLGDGYDYKKQVQCLCFGSGCDYAEELQEMTKEDHQVWGTGEV